MVIKSKKMCLPLGFLALGMGFSTGLANEETPVDQITLKPNTLEAIIVHVGSQPIFLTELQKAVLIASEGSTVMQSDGNLLGGSLTVAQATEILEQLIDQKILASKVTELNLDVEDSELDSEIRTFLAGQNITPETLQKKLAESGETYESYKEEFRKQLETQRFIGRNIRPLVSTNEEELKRFYLQSKPATSGATIQLRSLMIHFPEDIDNAQKSQKITTISKIESEVSAGIPFENLVKLYSEAPDARRNSGLLPPRKLEELPEEIRLPVKSAKTGQVLGPIRVGSSVFFFEYLKANANTEENIPTQERAAWENKLLELKFKEKLTEFIRIERSRFEIRRIPIALRR